MSKYDHPKLYFVLDICWIYYNRTIFRDLWSSKDKDNAAVSFDSCVKCHSFQCPSSMFRVCLGVRHLFTLPRDMQNGTMARRGFARPDLFPPSYFIGTTEEVFHSSSFLVGASERQGKKDLVGRECKLKAWRILNGMDVQKFWRARWQQQGNSEIQDASSPQRIPSA